jgi:outer membrane protein assembly factor BamB
MRLSFILFLLMCVLDGHTQNQHCWPNSRGDIQLKGYTPVDFPQKVSIKWIYDAEGIFKSAPVVCDNKIVVGSTSGELLCIDLQGKLLWKFTTKNAIEAPALIDNGMVYFGNLSGTLYALDLETGKLKWEYKTENQIMGSPTLFKAGSKTILAVGSYDYYLHGVDASTGVGLWKYESDNFLNSAPAIYKGKAVFGGCDGFLHLVNMTNGLSAGKVEVATYVASSPAIVGNMAYIGDYDAGFSCINLDEKKVEWRFQNTENNLPFIASPSVVGDKILIGSRDKFFYCLDRKTGKILWKKNTGNRVDASAVANNKQVLLINMRGDLMLLNQNDGSTVWTYDLGTAAINAPAVINNAIVVAGSDGNVYFLASSDIK